MLQNIIATQGLKGSGKDECAKFLNYILNTPIWMHYYWIGKLLNFKPIMNNWIITRYAYNLKRMLSILLNVDISRFEDRNFKENYYFDFNTYKLISKEFAYNTISDKDLNKKLKSGNLSVALDYVLSIRQILQFFGTEVIRKIFGDNLWILSTLNINNPNIIIADQRFKIENKFVSESNARSLIIHINRNGCSPGYHPSELEITELLENKKYDILLENNGTLKDLFNKCKTIAYDYFI